MPGVRSLTEQYPGRKQRLAHREKLGDSGFHLPCGKGGYVGISGKVIQTSPAAEDSQKIRTKYKSVSLKVSER